MTRSNFLPDLGRWDAAVEAKATVRLEEFDAYWLFVDLRVFPHTFNRGLGNVVARRNFTRALPRRIRLLPTSM